MLYCFWDTACNRCNYLSFLAIFCPFTPLTVQQIKMLENGKKKHLEISSFLHMCTKNYDQMKYGLWDMVCDRWTDRWTNRWIDGQKKWHIEVNVPTKNVETNYVVQDHHLIKNTKAIVLHKLTARELYSVLLLSSGNIPTSQKYYDKVFPNINFDGKKIYILPRLVTINSFQHNFQYIRLHNILYLNKILFALGKTKHFCAHFVMHAMRLLILSIYF